MKTPSKVLWYEGITLQPQQLQQQDRYHENQLHAVATAIHPCLWGVRALSWNRKDLASNSLRADEMSLLFQDGETYDAPGADELPAPVDLSTLPLNDHSFTFYAALPKFKGHGGNFSGSDQFHSGARYAQTEIDTPDLFTQAISTDIVYLKKTVHLVAQSEPRGAYTAFPVVRIRRLPKGGFELDPTFIPPSLSIEAAAGLSSQLDGLIVKMKAKLDSLYGHQREPSKNVIEIQSGDASSLWLLHAISSGSASLMHFSTCKGLHPERLFLQLLSLAGSMMAFSRKHVLADLPSYEHSDAGMSFGKIDTIIRDLIDTVISTKYLAIPLLKDPDNSTYLHGKLDSGKINSNTLLCLAVRANMPALELVAAVPTRFKIGAPDDVERSVSAALQGVELVHMPQVPAGVPVRPSTYYFAFEAKGHLFENMLKAQAVSIYVPDGIRGLELELFAVLA